VKLVNKNIHYAIKALLYFAGKPQEVISARALAIELKIHRPFLRKVLQVLSKYQMLKSQKGKGGGFILDAQPHKLRIIDIMNIFQVDMNIISCIFRKEVCQQINTCLLRKKLKNIENNLRKEFNTITIATLLKSMHINQ
jgi:Rrf2 family protein